MLYTRRQRDVERDDELSPAWQKAALVANWIGGRSIGARPRKRAPFRTIDPTAIPPWLSEGFRLPPPEGGKGDQGFASEDNSTEDTVADISTTNLVGCGLRPYSHGWEKVGDENFAGAEHS